MVLKNQQCLHCNFKTTKKASLQTHTKSFHEGQKFQSVHEGQNFLCTQCESIYTQRNSLLKHMKSVHEGQKFPCTQCESIFTQKGSCLKHLKSVHEGQNFL